MRCLNVRPITLPIMETQCEALFALLGDDVMGIVFECLGLEARKKKSTKRQRVWKKKAKTLVREQANSKKLSFLLLKR